MKADPNYQAKWHNLINLYQISSQTMKQFSDEQNVKVHQLQYWLKKIKLSALQESNQFIEVKIDKQLNTTDPIKLTMGKISIELFEQFNEETLIRLLRVVDKIV
ncbi:MAG: hypothetical protein WCR73_04490 [Acholeplasmataceae bacterium]|jgi:hypothetical protein